MVSWIRLRDENVNDVRKKSCYVLIGKFTRWFFVSIFFDWHLVWTNYYLCFNQNSKIDTIQVCFLDSKWKKWKKWTNWNAIIVTQIKVRSPLLTSTEKSIMVFSAWHDFPLWLHELFEVKIHFIQSDGII